MPMITSAAQQEAAARVRAWLAKYRDIELLLQLGEYRKGTDTQADEAIARMPAIREFLRQPPEELTSRELSSEGLMNLVRARADG
jgi:type III secretion protein N (ATPase)